MEKYAIKKGRLTFFLPKDPGGYCDFVNEKELVEVLKDPTSVVYFESAEDAWFHLLGNENGIDVVCLTGNTIFLVGENKEINYFASIEKVQ